MLCARTGGRAATLGRAPERGLYRDEGTVVRDLKVPLAVLHGDEEQLVNGRYFGSLAMPTLWRGAVQMIPGAGHAPQWETPEAFDALIEAFVRRDGVRPRSLPARASLRSVDQARSAHCSTIGAYLPAVHLLMS